MCYQRHFVCCSETELYVEMSCQIQTSCLLCLTSWLLSFAQCMTKLVRVPMLSLFHRVPAVQFEFATTRAFYRDNNHAHMTSCKSTLHAFAVFEMYCSEMIYQLIFL